MQLIDTLNHDFKYRNGTLIANSTILDVEIAIRANDNTTISMMLNSDIDLAMGDELRFKAWYGSDPATILDPGSFYVDSYTRVKENYKVDGIMIPFASASRVPVTYITQTLNQVVTDVATELGFTPNLSPNGTFIVGTSDVAATPRSFNATSKLDAFYKLGKDYAYFNYITNFQLFSVEYNRYWFDPLAQSVGQISLIENEWQSNSIDMPKVVDSIKWALPSPGVFTPADIDFVEWGTTVDLRTEGFYENITSANNRLRGFTIENTFGARSRRIKIPARIGSLYLPGKKLFVTELNGFSSPWVIRNHVYNYSSNGFTSTFDLQNTSYG